MKGGTGMTDLLLLLAIVAFFLLTGWFAWGCQRLRD
jgi:hypothetical protein